MKINVTLTPEQYELLSDILQAEAEWEEYWAECCGEKGDAKTIWELHNMLCVE